MRLLLDTHVAIWAITDNPNLPAKARELIANLANLVTVSVASIWEISIKRALACGKPNDMPISGAEAAEYFRSAGYTLLNISPNTPQPSSTSPTCTPTHSTECSSPKPWRNRFAC